MTRAGFPHSDTPGSTLRCQLPRAYRRLLRPSSALDAKASTMCPSQLVTHTTNPTGHTKRNETTGETSDAHQPPKPHSRPVRPVVTRHKRTGTPPTDQPTTGPGVPTNHTATPPNFKGMTARCSRPLSRSQ